MIDFEYYAPDTLQKALSLLDKYGQEARVLAGGTDLVVQMKEWSATPSVIIDVKHIRELNRLDWAEDKPLRIGAAVPLSKIIAFPPFKDKFEMLYQACSLIGSAQIRNRATLGGNICNAAPSADSAPALLCLGANAVIYRNGGKRTIPLDSFFLAPGETALDANELLVEIEVPAPSASSAGCYMRHTPREEMDIAVVGVASFLVLSSSCEVCKEARIALGAAAPTPVILKKAQGLLAGRRLSREVIGEAAEQASQEARPVSDMRGSEDYRREIVRVLTSRTLQRAWYKLKRGN